MDSKKIISNKIDQKIIQTIKEQRKKNCISLKENIFRKLLSLGELVDRLTIVNLKLFDLKNKVKQNKKNKNFKSWAAEEDIRLVEERSRLKICIDEKIIEYVSGENMFNSETKLYS